jgi:hypothetical protein
MVVAPFFGFKPFSLYLTQSDFQVYCFPAMTIEQTMCQRSLDFKNQIYVSDLKENISDLDLSLK